MMAIAIQNINTSFRLVEQAAEFVLAVPGEEMASEAMACGIESAKNVDKVKTLNIALVPSEVVSVPGLANAIANIELKKRSVVEAGDHLVVVGEVLKFGVNEQKRARPLLSVGPDFGGYLVLAESGIHRIGVVDG